MFASTDILILIHRPPFTIHHHKTIGSTNDLLKQMTDAPEFTCVVADEQTAGRGRYKREWHSTPGDGLYFSILLCPQSNSLQIPLLSLLAAISVAEVLIAGELAGVDIKWPNDVMVNERKICGVLVEAASFGPNINRIILGIGVNLNHRIFPDELKLTATSILIETGVTVPVDEFRDRLLERIAYWYEKWHSGQGGLITSRWQELSSYARGKKVTIMFDGDRVEGKTAGLTETGALQLITSNGELRAILAGEVMSVRG